MLFAYLGPDTFLPLTSIIAAVVGGVLMFGRHVMTLIRGAFRFGRSPGASPGRARSERLRGEATPRPHVRPGPATEGESLPSRR